MKLPLLLALSALVLAASAHAADVSGLWIVSTTLAQTPVTLDCSILQIGSDLSGWCEPESADAVPAALTGTVSQNSANWSYDLTVQNQPVRLAYQGTLSAGGVGMTGQLTYGTSSAGLTAARK